MRVSVHYHYANIKSYKPPDKQLVKLVFTHGKDSILQNDHAQLK